MLISLGSRPVWSISGVPGQGYRYSESSSGGWWRGKRVGRKENRGRERGRKGNGRERDEGRSLLLMSHKTEGAWFDPRASFNHDYLICVPSLQTSPAGAESGSGETSEHGLWSQIHESVSCCCHLLARLSRYSL